MGHLLPATAAMLLTIFAFLTLTVNFTSASAIPILPKGCSRVAGQLYCPSDSAPTAYPLEFGLKATPVPQLGYHGFEPSSSPFLVAPTPTIARKDATITTAPSATFLDKREYDPSTVFGTIDCGVSTPVPMPAQTDIARFVTEPFCKTLTDAAVYLWAGRPWVSGHYTVDGTDFALFIELKDLSTSVTIGDWCWELGQAVVQQCETSEGYVSGMWSTPEMQFDINVGPFTKRDAEPATPDLAESARMIPRGLADPVCNSNDLTLTSGDISSGAIDNFCEITNLVELNTDDIPVPFASKDFVINGVSLRVEAKLIDSDQVWLEEGICKRAFQAILDGCIASDLSGDEHGGSIVDNGMVEYSIDFLGPAKKTRSTADVPDPNIIHSPGPVDNPVIDPEGKNSYAGWFCDSGHPALSRTAIETDVTNNYCRDAARVLQPHGEWFIKFEINNVIVDVSATFQGDTGTVDLEEGACNRAFYTLFQACSPADGSGMQEGGWILDSSDNIWYIASTSSPARRTRDLIEAGAVEPKERILSQCSSDHNLGVSEAELRNLATSVFCRDATRTLYPGVVTELQYTLSNAGVAVSASANGKNAPLDLDEGACNSAFENLFASCTPKDGADTTQYGGSTTSDDFIEYTVKLALPIFLLPPPASTHLMSPAGLQKNPAPVVRALMSDASTLDARGNGYSTPTCATPGPILSKSDLDEQAVNIFCANTNKLELTPELGFIEMSFIVNNLPVRVRASALNGHQSFLEKGQCEKAIDRMLDACNQGAGGSIAHYDIGFNVFVG